MLTNSQINFWYEYAKLFLAKQLRVTNLRSSRIHCHQLS